MRFAIEYHAELPPVNARYSIDIFSAVLYILIRHGGVAKLVIAPACQAGDRGFNPRRSR